MLCEEDNGPLNLTMYINLYFIKFLYAYREMSVLVDMDKPSIKIVMTVFSCSAE